MTDLEKRAAEFRRLNPDAPHNPFDISTWGLACGRGFDSSRGTGEHVNAGTPNVRRNISGKRKPRGMASDSF